MAAFGRRSARQRLRKATKQALSVPTFRTPQDCTPWVLGGLWPTELNPVTADTATVADYLKRDMQRIADSANYRLRVINEAGLAEPVRQAEQNRVIESARDFAARRVASTVRQLRTQGPIFTGAPPVVAAPDPVDAPVADTVGFSALPSAEPERPVLQLPPESPDERLQRLVAGFARQEPGLRWAVADRPDGTTVVITDLAAGWIPPGVELPEGVDVLAPDRRTGNLRALLRDVERSATYGPGDPFRSVPAAAPDGGPGRRQAPEVSDLGRRLADATRWRDGLPRIAHTLAKAAAAGTGVVDAELEVLRVHADTARYQLLARYPSTDATVLLNCMLLAATDAFAGGDRQTANYHFAWFQALHKPTSGN